MLKQVLSAAEAHPTLQKLTISLGWIYDAEANSALANLIIESTPRLKYLQELSCYAVDFKGKEHDLRESLQQNQSLVNVGVALAECKLESPVKEIADRNQALFRARTFLDDSEMKAASPALLCRVISKLGHNSSGVSAASLATWSSIVAQKRTHQDLGVNL